MSRKYYGVGIHNKGDEGASYFDHTKGRSVLTPEYRAWLALLGNCYNPKAQLRRPDSRKLMSNDWLTFQKFRRWHMENFRADRPYLCNFDHDLWGESTCTFVTLQIDRFLKPRRTNTGLSGVHKQYNRPGFQARISIEGRPVGLGYFRTKEEAFAVYAERKLELVEEITDDEILRGRVKECLCRRWGGDWSKNPSLGDHVTCGADSMTPNL